ncbi:unnamed protein product [Candidula unifasciata]|uniref:Phospholipase A2-like central domain-containing protein n=1 Tax=Candidula unifasciata TaxID=100452 RepID=A0A8S4A2T3_9EUPU|nr:unnamed protein product [Candidula unifasciata]
MYPGTKWCGPGNVASGPDDLGPARKTDACCRDHDTKCDIYILSKETKYGVTNNEFYTVKECLERTRQERGGGDLLGEIIKVKVITGENFVQILEKWPWMELEGT